MPITVELKDVLKNAYDPDDGKNTDREFKHSPDAVANGLKIPDELIITTNVTVNESGKPTRIFTKVNNTLSAYTKTYHITAAVIYRGNLIFTSPTNTTSGHYYTIVKINQTPDVWIRLDDEHIYDYNTVDAERDLKGFRNTYPPTVQFVLPYVLLYSIEGVLPKPIFSGTKNFGNTCFVNSVVNLLTATNEFQLKRMKTYSPYMYNFILSYIQKKIHENDSKIFIKEIMNLTDASYSWGQQADASEFLMMLLQNYNYMGSQTIPNNALYIQKVKKTDGSLVQIENITNKIKKSISGYGITITTPPFYHYYVYKTSGIYDVDTLNVTGLSVDPAQDKFEDHAFDESSLTGTVHVIAPLPPADVTMSTKTMMEKTKPPVILVIDRYSQCGGEGKKKPSLKVTKKKKPSLKVTKKKKPSLKVTKKKKSKKKKRKYYRIE